MCNILCLIFNNKNVFLNLVCSGDSGVGMGFFCCHQVFLCLIWMNIFFIAGQGNFCERFWIFRFEFRLKFTICQTATCTWWHWEELGTFRKNFSLLSRKLISKSFNCHYFHPFNFLFSNLKLCFSTFFIYAKNKLVKKIVLTKIVSGAPQLVVCLKIRFEFSSIFFVGILPKPPIAVARPYLKFVVRNIA